MSVPTALAPLLERTGRCVYVLCRTSNPGAGEMQDLAVGPDQGSGAPGSRCTCGWRGWRWPGRPRTARSAWWSGRPPRPSWPRSAASPRPARSSCPGSARRAATPRPCTTSQRPARGRWRAPPGAVSWSTSRAASPGRGWTRTTRARRSRQRPRTGRRACGATMSTRRSGRRWRILHHMPDIWSPGARSSSWSWRSSCSARSACRRWASRFAVRCASSVTPSARPPTR